MAKNNIYIFKRSAFDPELSYILTDKAIVIKEGQKTLDKILFNEIRKIRLKYVPNRFELNSYETIIYTEKNEFLLRSTSFADYGKFIPQKGYAPFINALHAKLAGNKKIEFVYGIIPELYWFYWLLILLGFIFVLPVVYILMSGVVGFGVSTFVHLIFLVYLLPSGFRFQYLNKPGRYDPVSLPERLLPKL